MAAAPRTPSLSVIPDRRPQRRSINWLGRYMLANRREFPCQVVDLSPEVMAVVAPVSGDAGERVIAYVDQIGRLEGIIVHVFDNGFALSITATPRKRAKLAARLAALAGPRLD